MRNIVVFDFETGSVDINTLEILQIACLAIDPISLKIIPGSEFNSLIKPVGGCSLRVGCLEQGALNVNKITLEQLESAPKRSIVMKKFVEHVEKFGKGFKKPYASGKNIRTFDLPILNRILKEEGLGDKSGNIFDARVQIEIEDDLLRFFGVSDELPNLKMDTIRHYFGMDTSTAHDAKTDVLQTAWLVVKFLKLYREIGKRVTFKNSAKKDGGILG